MLADDGQYICKVSHFDINSYNCKYKSSERNDVYFS